MNRQPLPHCGNAVVAPDLRLVLALVPGEPHRRHVAARAVLVGRAHRCRCELRVRRRAAGLDGQRRRSFSAQNGRSFQWLPRSLMVPLPKSHQRYHFGPGNVDRIERPRRRRAEPQVPVEAGGNGHRLLRPLADGDDVVDSAWPPPALCQPQARDTQTWASRTGPMAPLWTSSTTRR